MGAHSGSNGVEPCVATPPDWQERVHLKMLHDSRETALIRGRTANAGAPIVKGCCTLEWGGLKAWG